ncbi:MAG TPA: DUF4255 domain-containing protein [Desulfuromonadales bacterium]|nr:DUF4255 domain-containing protein [Desulfuromonadales bacterium]
MLDYALTFLTDELNGYLVTRTASDSVKASLSRVVDEAGKYAFDIDSISCSIISIEEERLLKSHLPDYSTINGRHVVRPPELKLNLQILFAANFTHYDQALKYISYVLMFFQSHPIFSSDTHPALSPAIGKLSMELLSLNFEQLNQMWAFIGAKQLPSAVYRVRMVTLQDTADSAVKPPITTIRTTIQRR